MGEGNDVMGQDRGLGKQTDPKSFDSSVVRTAYTSTDFYH